MEAANKALDAAQKKVNADKALKGPHREEKLKADRKIRNDDRTKVATAEREQHQANKDATSSTPKPQEGGKLVEEEETELYGYGYCRRVVLNQRPLVHELRFARGARFCHLARRLYNRIRNACAARRQLWPAWLVRRVRNRCGYWFEDEDEAATEDEDTEAFNELMASMYEEPEEEETDLKVPAMVGVAAFLAGAALTGVAWKYSRRTDSRAVLLG